MHYSLTDFLTFLGSIGLFLYGMKSVSDGLQKIAGDHLRGIISDIKENKFLALLSGVGTTALVQSSSATTVIAVSSVNAGLISLAQAIAVIMGANVGTTLTTWIISVFGFHLDLFTYFLPLLAIGFPLYKSDQRNRSSLGELLIGFALLFFSISVLMQSAPCLDVQSYNNPLILAIVGIFLTIIVQASSAAFVVVVSLCLNGQITTDMACALMIGANIGTCVTPLISSFKANVMARRTALSHLLFNLFGAIWALAIFRYFYNFVNIGIPEFTIPLFHTSFNIVNVLIFIWLTAYFEKIVTFIIPDKDVKSDDPFKLQFISSGLIDSGEIALSQAKQETVNYSRETYKMFQLIPIMLAEPNGSARLIALHDRVHSMEDDSDKAEEEIADFLKQISTTTLSTDGDYVSAAIFRMIDEMESIADSIEHLAITIKHKSDLLINFNQEFKQNLNKMLALTDESLQHMVSSIEQDELTESMLNKAYNIEDEINNFRNLLRNSILEQIDKKKIEFQQSTLFMEIINECERIGDYVINVLSAMPRE